MANALDMLNNAGIPVPGLYGSETSQADSAYQTALQQIAAQQAQAAQQYGFKMNLDPSGALASSEIDPTQQFSKVMSLLSSNASGMKNLRETLSGQGLTGGGLRGLAAQRAALLRAQQTGQVANLGSAFANQYGDLDNQKAGALATKNNAYNQAAMDAINYAIQAGMFNQAPQATVTPSNDQQTPAPVQGISNTNPGPNNGAYATQIANQALGGTQQLGVNVGGSGPASVLNGLQNLGVNGTLSVPKPAQTKTNNSGQVARNNF